MCAEFPNHKLLEIGLFKLQGTTKNHKCHLKRQILSVQENSAIKAKIFLINKQIKQVSKHKFILYVINVNIYNEYNIKDF